MTPSASTRLAVLLGDPVSQSVSPAIHNDAFDALGIDVVYTAARVPADRFGDALAGLHALGAVGANVTVPHKKAAYARAETLGPMARASGAVNTLVRTPTGWSGHNTDVDGFAEPLRALGADLSGARAVVIGAGGAARATVLALREGFGLDRVDVAARRIAQAERLVDELGIGDAELRAVGLDAADLVTPALVVNATSVGMHGAEATPCPGARFREGQIVYDLVYGPAPTRLVRDARAAGAQAIDGLAMLVGQAAGAFRLWTGEAMDQARALAVARDALARRR